MAIGKEVISAYAGPADVNSFESIGKVSEIKTHKISYSNKEKELYQLYATVRKMREENCATEEKVAFIFRKLKNSFPADWLLFLELYELAIQNNFSCQTEILSQLLKLQENKLYKKLVQTGLDLLEINQYT